MKKFLLSIIGCLMAFVSVQAEEATLSFDNKANRTSQTTTQQVWEQNGIILTNNKGKSTSNVADYAKPARFYKSSELIIECTLGNINSIVFDCNSSSYATALKNSISGSTVSVSSDKVTVTLDGSSNTYKIANLSGGQVRMDALTVNYSVAGDNKPNTPAFSVAEGTYYEPFSVEITCATEGAAIYYTIDGTEPTATSTAYTEAIEVAETTTIKAVAIKDEIASSVATAVYTIETIEDIENVAAFYAMASSKGKAIKFINPLTVVYQNGQNLIVKDETGSMLIYGAISKKYQNGNVITGVEGTIAEYGKNAQLAPISEMPAATEGTAVEPKEVTITELADCDYLDYVKVEDVTFTLDSGKTKNYTMSDGTNKYAVYNQFYITISGLAAGNIYDVTGFVASYNGTAQFQPTVVALDEIATGIEEVATENAPVEYFNLQGIKVANPENGIFIKKQGAKATKVVL